MENAETSSMAIDAETLRNVTIFQFVDNDELGELAAHIDEQTFQPNQLIFKAGDPGNNMQIILSGTVQTYVTDDEGNKIIVGELGKGEMFGELSLLDNQPRSASAIATEPTKTFIIDQDDLRRLFTKKPEAAFDILHILGQRIRSTDALLRTRVARNANVVEEEKMRVGYRGADKVARIEVS